VTGIELTAAERKRQIEEEGFTAERDDFWKHGELAKAAMCYLAPPSCRTKNFIIKNWPFLTKWWKPSPDNRIRELAKSAALAAAEIDRLLRLEGKEEGKHTMKKAAPVNSDDVDCF
jgi:hypothetical protein